MALEPIFKVSNHHTPICGRPPSVDGDEPGTYHGYFENRHGEKSLFVYDRAKGEGPSIAGMPAGSAPSGRSTGDPRAWSSPRTPAAPGVVVGSVLALKARAAFHAYGRFPFPAAPLVLLPAPAGAGIV
jgi:hypothetical protein